MIKQTFLSQNFTNNNARQFDFDFFDDLLQLECFKIADLDADLRFLEGNERLQRWIENNDHFLLLGTGGSSLGARAVCALGSSNSSNSSSKKTIEFVDNLDPCSLRDLFERLDSSSNVIDRTGVLCISKSGETLETISQLLLVFEFFKRKGRDFSEKIVVITEDKPSTLKIFALENSFLCLDHSKNIGGRFSVLSVVGMLPAMICGIDPREIRKGAATVLHEGRDVVKLGAAFVAQNFAEGFRNHVSFVYSDKLAAFGAWLAQLYAESSGKDGLGITPVTARGSVDQHSQLQLYLDGPSDKCFSFFLEKQQDNDAEDNFRISKNIPTKFAYLGGKSISEIFEAQCNATIGALLEKGQGPLRKFEFPEVTPRILGELFTHFMLEVPCVCRLLGGGVGVNPFDQPAVERGKIITKELLAAKKIEGGIKE